MQVNIWIDPICPFCWITSRWLVSIAADRDLEIAWRPISLLRKNGLAPGDDYFPEAMATHRMLRVIVAAGPEHAGDLYAAFGRHIHHEGAREIDLAAVLTERGLDPALAEAADDETHDAAIAASMDEALALAGTDVGTPIIAIDGPDGRVGLFGPVITRMGTHEECLRLWDGFVALATTPGFHEVKRTRTDFPDPTTIR
jgi:predicted DsbA family dithiol-disulfide isomerase